MSTWELLTSEDVGGFGVFKERRKSIRAVFDYERVDSISIVSTIIIVLYFLS